MPATSTAVTAALNTVKAAFDIYSTAPGEDGRLEQFRTVRTLQLSKLQETSFQFLTI